MSEVLTTVQALARCTCAYACRQTDRQTEGADIEKTTFLSVICEEERRAENR
jgi:hypothetical protein